MRYLLNGCYLALLLCLAPWLVWQSVTRGKYRAGFLAKFWGQAPICDPTVRRIWLHAVSVGEVQLLRALIPAIQQAIPDVEMVISTTTRTGFQLARTAFPNHVVFYAPLDFSWAVSRAIHRVRPAMMLLVELELWPNWIAALRRQQVPVAVVNGRLSESSFIGYRRVRFWIARLLKQLDFVAAQTSEYAERFIALGTDPANVVVTGSIKFDNLIRDPANSRTRGLAAQVGLVASDVVVLAGSTQAPEEEIVLEAARSVWREFPTWRLILVPRHPERFDHVARILDQSDLTWIRRSEHQDAAAYRGPEWQVLLVDTVGELASWWGVGRIGFVGGSLGSRGGQNMMEPAAFGVALSFGPNTKNFRDVVSLLLAQNAAEVVHNSTDLTRFFRRCIADPQFARSRGEAARQVVLAQAGATATTVDLIQAYFADPRDAGSNRRVDAGHATAAAYAGDMANPRVRRYRVWQ